jgi:hypothetical protein
MANPRDCLLVMDVQATTEFRELTDAELRAVSGGRIPYAGGPMPVPYPHVIPSEPTPAGGRPFAFALG